MEQYRSFVKILPIPRLYKDMLLDLTPSQIQVFVSILFISGVLAMILPYVQVILPIEEAKVLLSPFIDLIHKNELIQAAVVG
jgi:hypothetical protein